MSSTKIQEAEKIVKQLQYESSKCERIMVSQASNELMDFCNTQIAGDYLIYKPPKQPNPWKAEKGICTLI